MHSQMPPERRAFESPEIGATAPPDRNMRTDRSRAMALPMLIAVLVLAAIVAVIILV